MMTTREPTKIEELTLFFGIMTPGQEKALREGFGLPPNPRLEDVKATDRSTPEKAALLLHRVAERIRISFPSEL